MSIGAYGAGYLSITDAFFRGFHPFEVASHFVVKVGYLEPESDRLRMYAVGPADGGHIFAGIRLFLEYLHERSDIFDKDIRSLVQQARKRGIEDVRRRDTHVDVLGRGPHILCDILDEGHHIVPRALLYLKDPGDLEVRLFLDVLHILGGNHGKSGICFTDENFDLEPLLILVLISPDPRHSFPCIPFNHATL